MTPVCDQRTSVRTDRQSVRVPDERFAAVLRGEEHFVFDGGMGTMLQARGLQGGELPELLCLTDPQAIADVHRAYVDAGSDVVTTNTFGANAAKLGDAAGVEEVFDAAVRCARVSGARYVAADIGPTGSLLEPLGTLPFDDAYELFARQARAAQAAGADLVIVETMTDLLEMKAAVLAVKENCDLPLFATMTFGEDGRTFLGTDPRTTALVLDALGVNALGINCSLGPADLRPLAQQMLEVATCPVIVQANAGLPQVVDGQTVYGVGPQEYAREVRAMIDAGVSIVGGCCGTTPDYIRLLAEYVDGRMPLARAVAPSCAVTSAQRSVVLEGRKVYAIGERINPTGKKLMKAALREGDLDYVVGEAIDQTQAGADLLDVNVGLPEIDEAATLSALVGEIQMASPLPLQIDSVDVRAVESAVRVYAGKPLVNSINGKESNLREVLPVVKHYGCAVVGLTLDEGGIPPTAEERLQIARRIVETAEEYGIPREDVFIDCLVMSAATNQAEVGEILRAVTLVKRELGVRTVLGVSNVSFGLPLRPVFNATFLAAAFSAGLDMPILNPLEERYREVVDTWRVLNGQDEGAVAYIGGYAGKTLAPTAAQGVQGTQGAAADASAPVTAAAPEAAADSARDASVGTDGVAVSAASVPGGGDAAVHLRELVLSGRKGDVPSVVASLLDAGAAPLDVVNGHLIPALDEVGEKFEAGTFFLPQLMASAEAAKAGFDTVKERMDAEGGARAAGKGPVVLATVQGDIHDIGKNIVKMLLENYGYEVIDLGRDVAAQAIVDAVLERDVKLVGLSALMTTTVASMEQAIKLLREKAPGTKVMVGGAVLNPEYAQMVGADYYAKDANVSARIAAEIFG